jgi:hypothetical protein
MTLNCFFSFELSGKENYAPSLYVLETKKCTLFIKTYSRLLVVEVVGYHCLNKLVRMATDRRSMNGYTIILIGVCNYPYKGYS